MCLLSYVRASENPKKVNKKMLKYHHLLIELLTPRQKCRFKFTFVLTESQSQHHGDDYNNNKDNDDN